MEQNYEKNLHKQMVINDKREKNTYNQAGHTMFRHFE